MNVCQPGERLIGVLLMLMMLVSLRQDSCNHCTPVKAVVKERSRNEKSPRKEKMEEEVLADQSNNKWKANGIIIIIKWCRRWVPRGQRRHGQSRVGVLQAVHCSD